MVMLKGVVHKLQRKISRSREDAKEGHFSVLATQDGFSKRFTVPLSYLSNPAFLDLLDEAEEEYGFSQKSVLTVPCHPSELERILSGKCQKERRNSSGNGRLRAQCFILMAAFCEHRKRRSEGWTLAGFLQELLSLLAAVWTVNTFSK